MINEALWDGMDGWDWMVIIGILRTPSLLIFLTTSIKISYVQLSNYSCFTWFVGDRIEKYVDQKLLLGDENYGLHRKTRRDRQKQTPLISCTPFKQKNLSTSRSTH